MQTEVLNLTDPTHIERAAVYIANGDVIGMYFNGTYAFLGDVDQPSAGDRIFELKQRARSKTLSLVTAPRFLPEFVDMGHAALSRYPIDQIETLYQHVHSLGLVFPADLDKLPSHLVVNGTILNVWTDFAPHGLLLALNRSKR